LIKVNIPKQELVFTDSDNIIRKYSVSTALNGAGEKINSECTPTGAHIIRAKIGASCDAGSVFIGRRPTGEIYSPALRQQFPGRDWILTRILWLSGLEVGKNRLGDVDTMRRYIYIHGCPDEDEMGTPGSHGCIKMKNIDLIELFDIVIIGTKVMVQKS